MGKPEHSQNSLTQTRLSTMWSRYMQCIFKASEQHMRSLVGWYYHNQFSHALVNFNLPDDKITY